MDMTPPQAPPAIVSSTQQEAVDALGRLIAVQAWLAAQQQNLPVLPAQPTTEGRDAWLASLEAFWQETAEQAPGTIPVPRIDALAARLASSMRDEAVVRRADGTLDAAAASMVERFARSRGSELPPGMEARSLRIGAIDYAGAVIVVDRSHPALILRFMPDRGWDVFDTLDRLHGQTELQWRQELARRRELPGIRADDTERVIANDRFVDSLPVQGDVFLVLARRIATLQREKVEDAWPSAVEADPSPRFTDEATAALGLHDKLDIFAILIEREARLAVALNEQRLAHVPEDLARGWRSAMERYRLARLRAASSARSDVDAAPLTLQAWSRKELIAAFSRRRIAVDPDDIRIETSGSEGFTLPVIGANASGISPAVPAPMTLAEFALRNIGHYDGRQLRIVSTGLPASALLPDIPTLRAMVRELDLAPRFASYLREQTGDPQGRRFRISAMRLQEARMRVETATARIATYLRDGPGIFVDDREERGYRMVEAVLDSPVATTRRTVGDHRVAVSQLVYQGAVVSDVLVIGMRDSRSSSRVVLYTPDAPDGRTFREFSDRAAAARAFLYAPAFQAYLLERLPLEYGEPVSNGAGRRFRVAEATRRSHWVLSAPREGRGTITEERFEERVVDGDIRTALFDAEIVRQARDVAWLGRSTAQADAESITSLAGSVLRSTRGPGAVVEDTLSAVGQALRATWRLYDSIKAGDGKQAFVDFTEAYTASLSLAGWHAGASAATRYRLSLRPLGAARSTTDAGVRFADSRQWLDSRYAVRDIDLSDTRPDVLGIHRLNGRRYIRQQELVFELKHDPGNDRWRLVRPNALDAAFPGPAMEPTVAGGWRLRTDIGLRGGYADSAAFPQPLARSISGRELDGLTDFQRWTFQQSFIRRLRSGGEASRIYWEAISQANPRPVTLRQRTAWGDALRTARATPAEPVPVDAYPATGASWRVLPPNEWPSQLWHYPAGAGVTVTGESPLVLALQALPGSGLTGLPATTRVPAAAGGPAWIRLHLDRYRTRRGTSESPGLRIIEDRRGPEPTYVIQPDEGFPIGYLGLEPDDFTAGGRSSP